MNTKAKLAAYNTMKAPQHGSKDYDLLKHLASHHKLVQKPYLHSDRLANEIFYALLDFATPDEIKQNRRGEKKEDHSVLSREAGTLTGKLEKAESIDQADNLLAEIIDIANQLPKEVQKTILEHATGAHTKVIDELKAAAIELEDLLTNIDTEVTELEKVTSIELAYSILEALKTLSKNRKN